MLEIKDYTDLENQLEKYDMMVLIFYARWCKEGEKMINQVNEIRNRYQYDQYDQLCFAKVNIDANPQIKDNYHIISLPSILIIKSKKVQRKFLMWSEDNIRKNIETNLLTYKF